MLNVFCILVLWRISGQVCQKILPCMKSISGQACFTDLADDGGVDRVASFVWGQQSLAAYVHVLGPFEGCLG